MVIKSTGKTLTLLVLCLAFAIGAKSQVIIDSSFIKPPDTSLVKPPDTVFIKPVDTLLRIKNFSPYFTLHVDSTLDYNFEINKDPHQYYWFLKNSPVGLKINKDNGRLHFKAEKSFFLSGKLKYDIQYKDIILTHKFYADFVVYDEIILEIKASKDIIYEHTAQTINYLKLADSGLGIIVNFNTKSLQHKRVVH